MRAPTFKQKIGCWLNERWRMELALCAPSLARRLGWEWPDLCNRHEIVSRCEDGIGRICHWKYSSFLTVCRFFPAMGGRLLRHCWLADVPALDSPVSVILPVRGAERFEAVYFVAELLRRMAGPDSEVLVCEHDTVPRYARELPPGIRHVFVPAMEGAPFNKSKALNAGAMAARHPVLVLHDADVVPSADFLSHSMALLAAGWEAVRPIRFLFLLCEADSQNYIRNAAGRGLQDIACVHQNFPGIATVLRRETYLDIGGHDERFEGCGWEDQEFLDRLRTRKLYPGSFFTAIHLWHPPAAQKQSGYYNAKLLEAILREPQPQRMETNRKKLGRPA